MVLTWTQALFGTENGHTENGHYGSRISEVDNDDKVNFSPVGDVQQEVDYFGV